MYAEFSDGNTKIRLNLEQYEGEEEGEEDEEQLWMQAEKQGKLENEELQREVKRPRLEGAPGH